MVLKNSQPTSMRLRRKESRGRRVFLSALRSLTLLAIFGIPALHPGAALGGEPPVSRYLPEIDAVPRVTAYEGHEPILLRWDLSKGTELRFTLRQQTQGRFESASSLAERDSVTMQRAVGEGILLLKGEGEGAEATLRDYRLRKRIEAKEGAPESTVEQIHPVLRFPRLADDGALGIWREKELPLGALMRLPSGPIAPGETVELPLRFPHEAAGSLIEIEGVSRLTFSGFVLVSGRLCARLDGDISLSAPEQPSDLEGDVRYAAKGKSVLFFDLELRRLVSGRIALRTLSAAQAPTPRVLIDGMARTPWPEWNRVSADLDSFLLLEEEGS